MAKCPPILALRAIPSVPYVFISVIPILIIHLHVVIYSGQLSYQLALTVKLFNFVCFNEILPKNSKGIEILN